jgi:hypothetical protein
MCRQSSHGIPIRFFVVDKKTSRYTFSVGNSAFEAGQNQFLKNERLMEDENRTGATPAQTQN